MGSLTDSAGIEKNQSSMQEGLQRDDESELGSEMDQIGDDSGDRRGKVDEGGKVKETKDNRTCNSIECLLILARMVLTGGNHQNHE